MVTLSVPSAPVDVEVVPVNATAVRLSWKRPASVNGILLGYYVYKDELLNGELLTNAFTQANVVGADVGPLPSSPPSSPPSAKRRLGRRRRR